MMMIDDDDLLKEFVNESREHLATIEADLLTIEEGGAGHRRAARQQGLSRRPLHQGRQRLLRS